jgi:hypothetical protein
MLSARSTFGTARLVPDVRLPFPFVVGCGRSGTTLLRAMLDAHPDIAVPFESYFPVWFARQRDRYETRNGFDITRFADDLIAHGSFQRWTLAEPDVRAALRVARPTNYSDAVRTAFKLYAEGRGKSRYADKTPVFVVHIPLLAKLFPEAVFIHLIRDGRDVVLSRSEVAWGSKRIDFEALVWQTQIEKGRADGLPLGPTRYLEVRYEDLLDDPERIARTVCEFIRVAFDPRMLEYHERATTILSDQPFPAEHNNLLRPPTKGLRDWRREMRPADIALIEELTGRTLERFGYNRTSSRATTGIRVRAIEARARYQAIARYRRARSTAARLIQRTHR